MSFILLLFNKKATNKRTVRLVVSRYRSSWGHGHLQHQELCRPYPGALGTLLTTGIQHHLIALFILLVYL